MGITALSDRNEIKEKNPLMEIQALYFEYLERNFGEYFEEMQNNKLSHHDVGTIARENQEFRIHIREIAPKILESLNYIWEQLFEPCKYHLEDLQCSKGIFAGDISPTNTTNIASCCGLYLDNIILPDPFFRMGPLFNRWGEEGLAYYLRYFYRIN